MIARQIALRCLILDQACERIHHLGAPGDRVRPAASASTMQTLAGPGVAASASRNARTPAITLPSNVVSRSVALRTAASSASAAASKDRPGARRACRRTARRTSTKQRPEKAADDGPATSPSPRRPRHGRVDRRHEDPAALVVRDERPREPMAAGRELAGSCALRERPASDMAGANIPRPVTAARLAPAGPEPTNPNSVSTMADETRLERWLDRVVARASSCQGVTPCCAQPSSISPRICRESRLLLSAS